MYSHARYQARSFFLHNTAVNLAGTAGDVVEFPVFHPKIEIIEIGLIAQAAFPNASTMTTRPVVSVDKLEPDATRTELGTVTPDYELVDNGVVSKDLNVNADDIHTPAEYPTAVQGDVIVLEHKTQGVGGTQSAKIYMIFREVEP